MPIHSIWRCLNTLYTSNMDVGCSKWWFTASTMTPQHIWAPPYPKFSKFDPYLHRYNSVRVHPYAHPQHIMALKQFIYMQIYVTWPIPHSDTFYFSVQERIVSVTSESKSVTSLVTNAKKTLTLGGSQVRKGSFFSTKLYRDHIDILLSEMGYSELVQRLFEKMTFFLVDPLPLLLLPIK